MFPIPLDKTPEGFIRLDVLLRRIPRPERMGWTSILVQTSILFGFLALGPASTDADFWCWIHPSSCPVESNSDVLKKHEVVFLFPGGKGKAGCLCHADLAYNDNLPEPVIHINLAIEGKCDSGDPDGGQTTDWQTVSNPGGFLSVWGTDQRTGFIGGHSLRYGEGRYRMHCEVSPKHRLALTEPVDNHISCSPQEVCIDFMPIYSFKTTERTRRIDH